ncbi:unnamed protein product [Rotaria magnacalcarata]|uniref:TH1 domain-containing protein n=2 Tax=Rotaria magnacalcarata TaxID=392030 RepID=A0A815V525_9BILA|nr:unnamed protein product [Rotaria magnacalcarata]CAF2099288.1 unnamed protein product [Rotaria magnacalcarata]
MRNSKVQDEEKSKRDGSQQEKQLPKSRTSTMKIIKDKPIAARKQLFLNARKDCNRSKRTKLCRFLYLKPEITFKDEVQPLATPGQSTVRMDKIINKNPNIFRKDANQGGVRNWQKPRLVIRSTRTFNQTRRASDTLLPLLMKTHLHRQRSRADSTNSTFNEASFQQCVNYFSKDKENKRDSSPIRRMLTLSASDVKSCMRRNKLDESISQYEMILRHLKNYDQFITEHPSPSPQSSASLKQRQTSFDHPQISTIVAEEKEKNKIFPKTFSSKRQTQSLSRNIAQTFSEFIANDIFLSSTPSGLRSLSISHASSKTDMAESIQPKHDQTAIPSEKNPTPESSENTVVVTEEVQIVLKELDNILDSKDQERSLTPNSQINVIVVNLPAFSKEEKLLQIPSSEKPLMQRLFEGKKTAYNTDELDMKPIRLPEDMISTHDIARVKVFFDSETLLYTTKMIKISRRGYKQHIRILCITSERLYNITKKNPYPKEAVCLNQILGVTCTPYKDGFMCIHTNNVHGDRGDWLAVVDHPCEFITQLFMVMGRDNNSDGFLQIKAQFTHRRRFVGECN